LQATLAERDEQVKELTRQTWEVSEWGTGLQATLAERDEQVKELTRKIREVSNYRTAIQAKMVEIDEQFTELTAKTCDLTYWVTVLPAMVAELDKQLVESQQALDAKHAELMKISDWAYGMMLELQRRNAPLHRRLLDKAKTTKRLLRTKLAGTVLGGLVRQARDSKRYRANLVSFDAVARSVEDNNGRLMITFPIIAWDFRWQRPQHIVTRLRDHGHSVLYLAMSMTPLNRSFRSAKEAGAALQFNNLAPHVNQIWLHTKEPLNIYSDQLTGDNLHNVVSGLSALLDTLKTKSVSYLIQFPGWWPVAEALRNRYGGKVIFDCMDDHGGFSTNTAQALKTEQKLIEDADLVITSSALLEDRCKLLNPNTIQVKNGTEFDHFHNPQPNGELDHLKECPIIGYYGAISDWFDMILVAYCAQERPQWQFVLVGSTFGADLSPVEGLPNVHFLGEKPYTALPGYLAYFVVCTIPFKLTPLTLATNPVKFYEYLSAGKPVVSIDLPELIPYAEDCYLARNAAEFLNQIDRALVERHDPEKIARRHDLAKANSWDFRVKTILAHAVFD
jgi:glycosyltransferase involved in cell wall biosynthesis